MPIDDDPITAALFDFVEQWHRDVERGERFGLEHYLERFPAHAAAVRSEYESLTAIAAGGGVAVASSPAGRRVGPYEIVRELGRGGQGAVYLARDTRLAREVALKILPPAAFVTESRLRRFRREAEVVAGLSHPGICDVLEADFAGDLPYIAMRHVPGAPIHAAIDALDLAERPRIRRAVELVARVARALHVAHEAGVVHRDVKPGNILVTPEGDPVILDFGLAREVGDVTLTEPGAVFGTLHYMAPEQLREDQPVAGVDRRVDVYALAVTLFEVITGRRPFEAQTREVLALKIRNEPPVDPRTINPAVSVDLGVVLAKALEKDPRRRYSTALEFAEDLDRVLRYEPILARPAGTFLKLRRWAQRHPLLSTSTALATLLLTAGLVVTLVLLEQVRGERERYKGIFYATHARKLLEQDPTFALLTAVEAARIEPSYLANTALYEALDACREECRLLRLERHRDMVVHAGTLRVALITNGGDCEIADLRAVDEPGWTVPVPVRAGAFDSGGARFAVGGPSGQVAVFDLASGAVQWAEAPAADAVVRVEFSVDGQTLIAGDAGGRIRLFDAASGVARGVFGEPGAPVDDVGLDADGSHLVSLDEAGVLRCRALPAGAPVWEETGPVRMFEISPDGARLAYATETEVRIAGVATGRSAHVFAVPRAGMLAFDPAGARLAVCWRGRLAVWSVDDGRRLVEQGVHRDQLILHVTFSADGERLATSGADSSVRILAADDGTLLHDFRSLKPHQLHAHFTPDGRRVISVGNNEQVLVHRLDERPGMLTLRGHQAGVVAAAFSPDGTQLLSASLDGTVRVWDRLGNTLRTLRHDHAVRHARWSLDGEHLVTGTRWAVRVWSMGGATDPVVLDVPDTLEACFGADGHVVTVTTDGSVRRWNRSGDEAPWRDPAAAGAAPVSITAVSDDGAFLAVGHDEPRVTVVPLAGSATRRALTFASAHQAVASPRVFALRFSPSGRYLAVGGQDTSTRLFDTETLTELGSYASSTPGCIAFDAAESLLVVGSVFNPAVAVLAIEDSGLRAVPVLRDHRSRIAAVDVHPSGSLILSASNDGTVLLYHAADQRKFAVLTGHTHAVTAAEFSPDGTAILTASLDGTLRLWPVDPLATARARVTREMNLLERRRLERDVER